MTIDVAALLDAARAGRPGQVRELTRGASEQERRAVLPEVKQLAGRLRKGDGLWGARGRHDAVGLALLACTTGPAAVATHIGTWWRWTPTDVPIVPSLVEREVDWLPEVLRRLSERPSPDGGSGQWDLVEELRLAIRAPRPATPSYLLGLVSALTYPPRHPGGPSRPALLRRLEDDGELVGLVPRILELESAGHLLGVESDGVWDSASRRSVAVPRRPEDTWSGAVLALCADGRLDRASIADTCLRMMLRGGPPARTAHHLMLLSALALTPKEVADRQRTYLQLLGDGSGPAAKHAQKALRTVDDAGLLDRETLLEAGRLVLSRPEKGLATTQLGWLDKVARGRDTAPDDVLLVVADAFAHERTDVQERGLAVVAKHLGRAADGTRDALVLAAESLAPSLRIGAADVLGATIEANSGPLMPSQPDGRVTADRGSWPRGARDVGELAEACAALAERLDDPVLLETVLAGVARLRNTDRAAFDTAMAPVRHRLRPQQNGTDSFSAMAEEGQAALAQARLLRMLLLEPPPRSGGWRGLFARSRHVQAHALPDPPLSPTGVAVQRMRELAVRVMDGEVADLVATPTEADGQLDPAALADRLAALEAGGRQPWPADLQQAMLRLPRGCDQQAVVAADRLRSPAGRLLAEQLRRGHLDPGSRLLVGRIVPRQRWMWPAHPTDDVALVALDGPPPDPTRPATLAFSLPDPFLRAGRATRTQVSTGMGLWASTLPAHAEVLAAHALPALCDLTMASGTPATRSLVAALPGLHGPAGPALWAAMGYALGAADAADRTSGVDAVVGLAGRGLDGAPAGEVLSRMVCEAGLKVGRVAGSLGEALRAGPDVATFVWRLASAALPAVLPAESRDTHKLLAVAADAAALAGARGTLDGLGPVAGRGGSSRLVTEARRLAKVLTG